MSERAFAFTHLVDVLDGIVKFPREGPLHVEGTLILFVKETTRPCMHTYERRARPA